MSEAEDRKSVIDMCKEQLLGHDITYIERRNLLAFLERDIVNSSFCQLYRSKCSEVIEREVH